ncbi:MAG TPA: hypothetical protein VFI13_02960, partial [Gemmatimonadales bacterium]|nr:hypothetical protein [Gemmatimonadales bacterium]
EKNGNLAIEQDLSEHGIAPADRIDRLIEGVLRRLGDDLSAAPLTARIAGAPDRWNELLESAQAPAGPEP